MLNNCCREEQHTSQVWRDPGTFLMQWSSVIFLSAEQQRKYDLCCSTTGLTCAVCTSRMINLLYNYIGVKRLNFLKFFFFYLSSKLGVDIWLTDQVEWIFFQDDEMLHHRSDAASALKHPGDNLDVAPRRRVQLLPASLRRMGLMLKVIFYCQIMTILCGKLRIYNRNHSHATWEQMPCFVIYYRQYIKISGSRM